VEVSGLPLHILLVHGVVVLIPLAALVVALTALWPAARRRLGVVSPILAVVAFAFVPVTIAAGNWLQERLPSAPLIEEHAALGPMMLPWSIALALVAIVGYLWHRVGRRIAARWSGGARRAITIGLAILSLVVAVGATAAVVVVGESGSRAVWEGSYSGEPLER
jgi:hypothetical protein